MDSTHPKVTAATIMYGDRWHFLSQVVHATLKDPYVVKLVIVDNGSPYPEKIQEGVKIYGDRVVVLRQEKNLGSAGGFAIALDHARKTDCDFVLLLDDDSVPQEGIVRAFVDVLKLFPDEKVVLCGNRDNVLANKEFFYRPTIADYSPRRTFFEVFSWRKFSHFFALLLAQGGRWQRRGPFVPIVPNEGFVYGGAFVPIAAVREAPLPDKSLFLYGDDVEYSWNIKNLGYRSYLCAIPKLYDIDLTFGTNTSHIFGQFDKSVAPFKVYYRLRNMVRLSRKHSKQGGVALFSNIIAWVLGLLLLGFSKYGFTTTYWSRAGLIIKAVYAGYLPHSNVAKRTEASFFQ